MTLIKTQDMEKMMKVTIKAGMDHEKMLVATTTRKPEPTRPHPGLPRQIQWNSQGYSHDCPRRGVRTTGDAWKRDSQGHRKTSTRKEISSKEGQTKGLRKQTDRQIIALPS